MPEEPRTPRKQSARGRKSRVLGDRCAICTSCGWARRYLVGVTAPPTEPCPDCGGTLLTACPACGEPPESVVQVTCRVCGEALRDGEAFGVEIRRRPELPHLPHVGEAAG